MDFQTAFGNGFADREENPRIARRRITAVCMHMTPLRCLPWSMENRSRSERVAVDLALDQPQTQPVPISGTLVDKQAEGSIAVDDHGVDITVVIDVPSRQPATHFGDREGCPCRLANLFEDTRTEVAKELVGLVQRIEIASPLQSFDTVDGTVGNHQIEPTIAINIEPGSSESGGLPACRIEPGPEGAIVEATAAVVHIEGVGFTAASRARSTNHGSLVAIVGSLGLSMAGLSPHPDPIATRASTASHRPSIHKPGFPQRLFHEILEVELIRQPAQIDQVEILALQP